MRAPTVEEKQCPACGEVKRAALYYPNTIAPDGLSEKCRSCCKSQAAEIRCAILAYHSASDTGPRTWCSHRACPLHDVPTLRCLQVHRPAHELNSALSGLCRRQSMAEDAALRGEAAVQAAVRSNSAGLEPLGLPPPHPSAPDALRAAYAAATEGARPGGFSWGGPVPTAQASPAAGGGLRKAHRSDNGAGIR